MDLEHSLSTLRTLQKEGLQGSQLFFRRGFLLALIYSHGLPSIFPYCGVGVRHEDCRTQKDAQARCLSSDAIQNSLRSTVMNRETISMLLVVLNLQQYWMSDVPLLHSESSTHAREDVASLQTLVHNSHFRDQSRACRRTLVGIRYPGVL